MQNIHGGDIYKYEQIIDFSANINPLGTPESVKTAIRQAAESADVYPQIYSDRLRSALAKHLQVQPEQIICGNGAADIIYRYAYALRANKALLTAPCFVEYEQALHASGTKQIDYYALNHTDFQIQEDFLDMLRADLDVVFLCNPNNPTGMCINEAVLTRIVQKCFELQIALCVDECFIEFLEDGADRSLLSKISQYPNLLIIRAFTKSYAMAGVRLGYGMTANQELIEKMYICGASWNVSVLAQAAGIAALQEKGYLAQTRAFLANEKQYLYTHFDRLGIHYWKGAANYIFFQAETNLGERLLQKHILLRDCRNYHNLPDTASNEPLRYYRIAVRTRAENVCLIQALQEIYSASGKERWE